MNYDEKNKKPDRDNSSQGRESDQGDKDYSDLDIDESTGGSAMGDPTEDDKPGSDE